MGAPPDKGLKSRAVLKKKAGPKGPAAISLSGSNPLLFSQPAVYFSPKLLAAFSAARATEIPESVERLRARLFLYSITDRLLAKLPSSKQPQSDQAQPSQGTTTVVVTRGRTL